MQPTVIIHFVGFFMKPSSYWSSVKEGFRGLTPQALMLLIRKAVDEENLGTTATRFGKPFFFVLIGLFGCRN